MLWLFGGCDVTVYNRVWLFPLHATDRLAISPARSQFFHAMAICLNIVSVYATCVMTWEYLGVIALIATCWQLVAVAFLMLLI